MNRFFLDASDTVILKVPLFADQFTLTRPVEDFAPPARKTSRAAALPLWKLSLQETPVAASLGLRICFAVLGAAAAGTAAYGLYSLFDLMRDDALGKAVQAFIG